MSYIRFFGKYSDLYLELFVEYLGVGGLYLFVVVLLELFGELCLIFVFLLYLRNDFGMYVGKIGFF